MIGLSILLACCYGIYSFTDGSLISFHSRQVEHRREDNSRDAQVDKSSTLLGGKIKTFLANLSKPSKKKKQDLQSSDAKHIFISNAHLRKKEKVVFRSVANSSRNEAIVHAKSFAKDIGTSDEYLLIKYDAARLHKDKELLGWKSLRAPFCKRELSHYKAVLAKTNKSYLADNVVAQIQDSSAAILSMHEKHKILSRDELSLITQLRRFRSLDLDLCLQQLRFVDNLFRRIPVFVPEHSATITSHFGQRLYKRKIQQHKGVDMTSHEAIVYASAEGRVEFCGWSGGYGNLIVIDHGKIKTKYGHLRRIKVAQGDYVKQGQNIGCEGSTGRARGRHLHFEVLLASGKHVDPMEFIHHSMKESQKTASNRVLAMQQDKYLRSTNIFAMQNRLHKAKTATRVNVPQKAPQLTESVVLSANMGSKNPQLINTSAQKKERVLTRAVGVNFSSKTLVNSKFPVGNKLFIESIHKSLFSRK